MKNNLVSSYELNSSIELPHEDGVNALSFQPITDEDNVLAVTTGKDDKFKLWNLMEPSHSMYNNIQFINSLELP